MAMNRWIVVVVLILAGGIVGGSLEAEVGRPLAMLFTVAFAVAGCLVMESELDRRRRRKRAARP
jgi:hypothetical protein